MTKDNKIGEIMEKIKSEKIAPESKLAVNWKSYLFWLIWGAMILLGAIFFSLVILNFFDLGPEIFQLFDFPLGRLMHLLMMTTPFVWLGLVLVALVSGLLALRKTKRGYRYGLLLVTALSVLFISLLGGLLHFSKFNQKIGGRFYQNETGPGQRWAFPMGGRWRLPEDGFLGGSVLEARESSFLLESLDQERWEVFFDQETKKEINWPLEVGIRVGLMGEKSGEYQFNAKFIKELPERNFSGHGGPGMERRMNLRN